MRADPRTLCPHLGRRRNAYSGAVYLRAVPDVVRERDRFSSQRLLRGRVLEGRLR